MSKIEFIDDKWKIWIWSKVQQGYCKNTIFKTLLDNNFNKQVVEKELSIRYDTELDSIYNRYDDKRYIENYPGIIKSNSVISSSINKSTVYMPNSRKYQSDNLELYEINDFMNKSECLEMINIINRKGLRRSTVTKTNNEKYDLELRTSSTCDLNRVTNEQDKQFINQLEYRISKMLGINIDYSEPIQGQKYTINQHFKQHSDYFTPTQENYEENVKDIGNRTWTFMVYLNNVEEGGETNFPNINYSVKPILGKAVVWYNLNKNGTGNYNSIHEGSKIIKGEKYIITKWFRERGRGRYYTRLITDMLPNYTPNGFKMEKVPINLLANLKQWYNKNLNLKVAEPLDDGFLQNPKGIASDILSLDYCDKMKNEIDMNIRPILEKWSKQQLKLSAIYGVRSFRRNSSLKPYCDTRDTHVISAVIHLGDSSDQPWSFYFEDNYYRKHNIYFREGDLFLYEGARCIHGRPNKYKGDDWRTIYVHYTTKNWGNILKDREKIYNLTLNQNNSDSVKRNIILENKKKCRQPEIKIMEEDKNNSNILNKYKNISYDKKAHHFHQLFLPNANKYPTNLLQLYELDNFMNEDECNEMIRIADSITLRKSTVTHIEGSAYDPNFRTSSTSDLNGVTNTEHKLFIKKLEYRMAKILGINPDYSEPIQIQKYTKGQQFKNHHDWFGKDEEGYEDIVRHEGNRSWTFMVYLNTTPHGGETNLVALNKKFKAIRGKALIWNNLNLDGSGNYDTMHAGLPIIEGEKWIITKWFRERGNGPKYIRTINDMLPNFHTIGFEKRRVPKELFNKITTWFKNNLHLEKEEPLDQGFLQNPSGIASDIVSLDMAEELKREIDKVIKPIFEEWAGMPLFTTAMYGIRSYRRDSSLKMHCDTWHTHVISAIIHVEDDSDESWPLKIVDNYYREHDIHFEKGDLVLYESSRCMHGRPTKYKGNKWSNMYIHYSPHDWRQIVDNLSKFPHNKDRFNYRSY